MKDSGQDNLSPGQMARLLAFAAGSDTDTSASARLAQSDPTGDLCPDDEAAPLCPGDRVDPFEILREIGRGGMCFVFEAYDTRLDRRVALKVLRPSLARTPSTARRFYRESVMAGGLCDPCVAAVYTQGHCDDGTPYFAMEYIQGRDLDQVIRREGPMPPQAAAQLALTCARALHHAHQKGLIHRDVTPRNVLLCDDDQRCRLLDFGVAQDTTGRWTQTTQAGSSVGTVAFMSPEQNLGQKLDRRTDVFSLGLVLYFALTGRRAYQADNRAELALAFQLQTPPEPCRLRPDVPGELSAIVMRMLAIDRDQRYQTCESVQADLQAFVAGRSDLLTGLCRSEPTSDAPAPILQTGRAVREKKRLRHLPAALLVLAGAAAAWGLLGSAPAQSDARRSGLLTASQRWALDGRGPEASSAQQRQPTSGISPGIEAESRQPPTRPAPAPPETEPVEAAPNTTGANAPATAKGPPDPGQSDASLPKPDRKEVAAPSVRAVVLWIYQPDSSKDFEDEGILLGQTTLHKEPTSLGLYGFDPRSGLREYKSPLARADFRVVAEQDRLVLIADSDGDGPGERIKPVASQDHPGQDALDRLHTKSRYPLKPSSTLFVVCVKGGHALLRVEDVLDR